MNVSNLLSINSPSSSNSVDFEHDGCNSRFLMFIFKTQPMFLLIFGFIANLCSFAVLIRPRLRRRPTFSYLAFLSLSNSLLSLIHASFYHSWRIFRFNIRQFTIVYILSIFKSICH